MGSTAKTAEIPDDIDEFQEACDFKVVPPGWENKPKAQDPERAEGMTARGAPSSEVEDGEYLCGSKKNFKFCMIATLLLAALVIGLAVGLKKKNKKSEPAPAEGAGTEAPTASNFTNFTIFPTETPTKPVTQPTKAPSESAGTAAPTKTTAAPTAMPTTGTAAPTAMPTTGTAAPTAMPTTGTSAPTTMPTSAVTAAASLDAKIEALISFLGLDSWDSLNDTEKKALDWVAHKDVYHPPTLDFFIAEQRFALADLYFATKGNSWNDTLGFIDTNSSVCDWNNGLPEDNGFKGVSCDNTSHVIGVNLANNGLSGEIPTFLPKLSSLSSLNLEGNALTGSIPEEIGSLTLLTSLSLANNKLIGTLPSTIQQLTSMEEIFLSQNMFTGILPINFIEMTGLNTLHVDQNNFVGQVPTLLAFLTGMTELWLNDNDLTGDLDSFCDGRVLTSFQADCGGNPPLITCTCCTVCCDHTTGECSPVSS